MRPARVVVVVREEDDRGELSLVTVSSDGIRYDPRATSKLLCACRFSPVEKRSVVVYLFWDGAKKKEEGARCDVSNLKSEIGFLPREISQTKQATETTIQEEFSSCESVLSLFACKDAMVWYRSYMDIPHFFLSLGRFSRSSIIQHPAPNR